MLLLVISLIPYLTTFVADNPFSLLAETLYGLDFIPVCREDYDFLVLKDCYGHPEFQEFLKCLQNDEFKMRLEQLHGYEVDSPGRIIYGGLK